MIEDVLNYARARMDALGFIEWEDALNLDNIPRTILSQSYHLELGTASRRNESNDNIEILVPFVVRTFVFGFLDTKTGRETSIQNADSILDEFLLAANRLNYNCLKTVFFDSMSIEPIATNNDNVIQLKMDFTGLVTKSTR